MLQIDQIQIEHAAHKVTTDNAAPSFSFSLTSDHQGCELVRYRVRVLDGGKLIWDSGEQTDGKQIGIRYQGQALHPFRDYTVEVSGTDNFGESATGKAVFATGRMDTPWRAKWITDKSVEIPKKSSPHPLLFRKTFHVKKTVSKAFINVTALGIYEIKMNGEKIGDQYFAPGFTSYLHQMQYQTYPVALSTGSNLITVTVGGGWAVGAFTIGRKNRIYADTPSLLLELHITYEDGTEEIVGTDESWQVTQDGKLRFADWYDGETYDATIDEKNAAYKNVDLTAPRNEPKITAEYGMPVRAIQKLDAVCLGKAKSGDLIYDFGQNFAGVIAADINGKSGQQVTFRHAEVLVDGELFTKPLRSAKATVQYICIDGEQSYSPTMTFMGFRYVGVSGIDAENLSLKAYVLSSDSETVGSFICSNEDVNRLQQNIVWGGRSNFVDIPTDCPQRDERMGWTGDIAVFASTAAFNFDMSRFLDKWLLDVKAEQGKGGGIPMTVPNAGGGFPAMANSCWGDCCVLVPWAEYMARGDLELLRRQYPTMKRFLKAAKWWAGFLSVGENKRRIWRFPFHWGDWCAPGGTEKDWFAKTPWVATAYFANSCKLVAKISRLLGEEKDAVYYEMLAGEICEAYRAVFTDGSGKLKKEFQTGYVLPIHFEIVGAEEKKMMTSRLKKLVEDADWHLATGFPATPYLLFALADNNEADTAYRLLMQDTCPSWLYEVKAGGTTIWERWDALRPDGTVNLGTHNSKDSGMVSFNHYAYGAVGDFLYRRVAGIEAVEGGYKTFRIAPIPGGGLTYAEATYRSPYGLIRSAWKIEDSVFKLDVKVPVSTSCEIILPSGKYVNVSSGSYKFEEAM